MKLKLDFRFYNMEEKSYFGKAMNTRLFLQWILKSMVIESADCEYSHALHGNVLFKEECICDSYSIKFIMELKMSCCLVTS